MTQVAAGAPPASSSGAEVVVVLGEIRDVLQQIRDVLAYMAVPPPAPAETTPSCAHPPDRRVSLSSMGETRWKCRECKYEHVEPRVDVAAPPAPSS